MNWQASALYLSVLVKSPLTVCAFLLALVVARRFYTWATA